MGKFSLLCIALCAVSVQSQITVPPGPAGGLIAAKAIENAATQLQSQAGDLNAVHARVADIMDNIQAVILVNSPSATSGPYGAPGPVNLHSDEDLGAAMFQGLGKGFKSAGTGTSR
ncbi:uncharacterized protein LOC129591015 [Paramacrobiotus metropolitanus]|uniref:uncharacterized protein LOC129591015 n=1 Tax=Paramacrobiotus metropolitanus TaxID=2943436 RepID=UPI002445A4FE|nr:uncharacterized protein LOC129591015 [Paramacrobiotus metropolitanus]